VFVRYAQSLGSGWHGLGRRAAILIEQLYCSEIVGDRFAHTWDKCGALGRATQTWRCNVAGRLPMQPHAELAALIDMMAAACARASGQAEAAGRPLGCGPGAAARTALMTMGTATLRQGSFMRRQLTSECDHTPVHIVVM
jgi:hypothetical protein